MRITRLFVNIIKFPGHSEGGLGKTMNMETRGETLNNTHSHSEVTKEERKKNTKAVWDFRKV